MSFLSSIAPALGGIGQGVTQGLNALNQQDQQKFQKEQQDRMRQSWADQDATNTALKGIQQTAPTGAEYYDPDSGVSAKAQVARPTPDILADQARIYMNSTDPKNKALGLQLADKATQLEKQKREQDVFEKYRPQFDTLNTPNGALEYLNKQGIPAYNAKVPDGYRVTQGETLPNGQTVFTVLDNNNKIVESHAVPANELQNIAAKHLTGLAQHELGYLNAENFRDFIKSGLENRKVVATEQNANAAVTTAEAAQKNADTQANFHREGGIYQQIENAKNQTQLRIAKMQEGMHGMLNPLQEQDLADLKSFSALTTKFQNQLDDPNTSREALEKTANQLAVHPSGKALNTVLVHDAETGQTSPVTVNKFSHLVDQHQLGKASKAAKAAIQSGNMIDPITKKSRPITLSDVDAYNKAFPNTPVDPSTLPYLKTK